MEELALKRRGFSFQHEYHWKQVEDEVLGTETKLEGSYAQAGYFLHELKEAIPEELEVAVRLAFVDPDTSQPADLRTEATVGLNWFFDGHRNKLTLDASRLRLEQPGGADLEDDRVRIQWDVSF